MTAELKVLLVGYPAVNWGNLQETGYVVQQDVHRETPGPTGTNAEWQEYWAKAQPNATDELHEACGRGCYESWHRPNPETAENADYLGKNIIGKEHFSVLAHGHVTFYVAGVSRALLLELERHQKKSHLNFSVVSQRYVDHGAKSDIGVVVPPLFDAELKEELDGWFLDAQERYGHAYHKLRDAGHTNKEARGAARAFLPENTETRFFVTASIRGWRDVLEQRLPETADAEIRQFAMAVLKELVKVAPNSVQDFTEQYLTEGDN